MRLLVCGLAAAQRLVELRASRRHVASYPDAREGRWSRRTFPLIVLVHTTVIAGTLVFGGKPRPLWLAIFLGLQPLRFWVLRTLGPRWNARGIVPATMAVAGDGPYAHVRHPNYAIVAGELWSLPAAFGLRGLALAATGVNALLLAVRIREEEQLLMAVEGYRERFEAKPRFLPRLV